MTKNVHNFIPKRTLEEKMNRTIKFYGILVLIAIFVLFPHSMDACPNCKDAFATSTTQASIGQAFSLTVYMLIATPIIVISVISTKVIRHMRKAQNGRF